MSLSQIELVWVRIRVEWECFWVNLREDNKGSESKMALSESIIEEFKMAAIIKFSENEWVKFILCKMAESKMAEFKRAALIKLIRLKKFESESEWRESVLEWIWEKITRCLNTRWQCLNPTWAEFKMAAIIKLSHNEWVKFFCANVGTQSWQVLVS